MNRKDYPGEIRLSTDGVELEGSLIIPEQAQGIVVFAHGSGSSRFSPRNRAVAQFLNEGGLATLLFDLLTADENEIDLRTRQLRFDIGLLSRRLIGAVDWLGEQERLRDFRIGLFGASTGAAAALIAAARRPETVAAVVSRGGRADLAGEDLPLVQAPTLLIVGSLDEAVIGMNRWAAGQMQIEPRLEIVRGASHLFEEPGTMDQVARLTRDWFVGYLVSEGNQ
ncbi:MAG: dienelactone hydrolase family protein [Marinobacter sp.]|nr:dienelactone hydrolase family protein [Marinobacter sp.]